MRSFGDARSKKHQRRVEQLTQAQRDHPEQIASPPAEPLPEDRVVGIVQAVGDDEMATVLVGADEVEYVFPMHLLPDDVHEGTMLYLVLRDGRLEVIGERKSSAAEPGQSVEDRLERGLNKRRMRDLGSTDDA